MEPCCRIYPSLHYFLAHDSKREKQHDAAGDFRVIWFVGVPNVRLERRHACGRFAVAGVGIAKSIFAHTAIIIDASLWTLCLEDQVSRSSKHLRTDIHT